MLQTNASLAQENHDELEQIWLQVQSNHTDLLANYSRLMVVAENGIRPHSIEKQLAEVGYHTSCLRRCGKVREFTNILEKLGNLK